MSTGVVQGRCSCLCSSTSVLVAAAAVPRRVLVHPGQRQLHRTMGSLWTAAGVTFEVRNAGQGGGCGDDFKNQVYCVRHMVGDDITRRLKIAYDDGTTSAWLDFKAEEAAAAKAAQEADNVLILQAPAQPAEVKRSNAKRKRTEKGETICGDEHVRRRERERGPFLD